MSRHVPVRRSLVALASVALIGGGLAAPAAAAPVVPPADADPRPATQAGDWLVRQLDAGEGLLTGDFGPLYGQSIDAALTLDALGGRTAAIGQIGTAFQEGGAGQYIEYEFGEFFGQVAGATGKVLVLADLIGADPTDFGGFDLVERAAELTIQEDGPTQGRIFDTDRGNPDYSFANSLGQAFMARGLAAAEAPLADEVLGFLLDQQCASGGFREGFSPIGSETQSCDAAGGSAALDATSIVAAQLAAIADVADVDAALASARTWLASQQTASGGFGNPVNANSTGLAGFALGVLGDTAAAERAAVWLRARQVWEAPECATAVGAPTDRGAIAYDDEALAAARRDGIAASQQQWNITASQAAATLLWAPAATGAPAVGGPEWVRAGRTAVVTASGYAPGETVCLQLGPNAAQQVAATATGVARATLAVPAKSARRAVRSSGASGQATGVVKALAGKTLGVNVAKRPLKRGTQQRIVVRGLAAGEPTKVFVRGRRIAAGEAGPKGRFVATVRLPKAGPAKVRAVGVFPQLRKGRTAFRVVR